MQQAFQSPSSHLAFNVINIYEGFKNNAYIIIVMIIVVVIIIIIAGKRIWNIMKQFPDLIS